MPRRPLRPGEAPGLEGKRRRARARTRANARALCRVPRSRPLSLFQAGHSLEAPPGEDLNPLPGLEYFKDFSLSEWSDDEDVFLSGLVVQLADCVDLAEMEVNYL